MGVVNYLIGLDINVNVSCLTRIGFVSIEKCADLLQGRPKPEAVAPDKCVVKSEAIRCVAEVAVIE